MEICLKYRNSPRISHDFFRKVYYCGVGCQKKDICRHRQEDGCGKRQEVS